MRQPRRRPRPDPASITWTHGADDGPTRLPAPRLGPAGVLGLVGAGAALAALVAVVLTTVVSGPVDVVPGLSTPDRITTLGLPAVRVVAEIAMAVAVGALLLAAFLVPPQRSGYLDVAGYRAVRAAASAALVWALAAALMVPLTVADSVGRPLGDVLDVGLLAQTVPRLSTATAWLVTALIALLVLAACRTVLGWGWTVVTFGLCVLGPLPVALTGHSATGGAHDIASDSLVLHVVAACLWVGGLVAVLATAVARGPDRTAALATAVPRYSRMALVCWVTLGLTGVVNALLRVAPADLFTTGYGALVVAKTVALITLGAFGWAHRRRTVGRAAAGEPRALVRLGVGEVVLMLATIGLAVALGRSAPPPTAAGPPSRTEVLIGYDLVDPPTALRLLLDWRFNLIFGTAALVLAAVYLAGVRRLRRRGDAWGPGRTIAWLCGCAALLLATSSGIGRYGPAMFSVHMAEHMILSMLVPILLVMGGPVTLALRALPPAGRAASAGSARVVVGRRALPVGAVLHPPVGGATGVRRQLLRPVLLGAVRGRAAGPRRARGHEPALPGHRSAVLLAADRYRSGAPPRAPGRTARDRVRLGAVPRLLRGGAHECGHGDRRRLLPRAGPSLGDGPAARPAVRWGSRVGLGRAPVASRGDRPACAVVAPGRTVGSSRRPPGRRGR